MSLGIKIQQKNKKKSGECCEGNAEDYKIAKDPNCIKDVVLHKTLYNQSGPRKGYLKGDDLASNISHTNYVNLSEEKQTNWDALLSPPAEPAEEKEGETEQVEGGKKKTRKTRKTKKSRKQTKKRVKKGKGKGKKTKGRK